jgi:hypothetical protein
VSLSSALRAAPPLASHAAVASAFLKAVESLGGTPAVAAGAGAPLYVGPLLPSPRAAPLAPALQRGGDSGATVALAALRLPRNTLSARRALVRAAASGEALPALLARLPGRQGAVVRELAADVLSLRARLAAVIARVEAAGGGGGSGLEPPLVAVEVQQELAARTARLLEAAGPEVGAALLRELTEPAAEAAARAQLGLPPAPAGDAGGARGALDSRVVPNSRSRATVVHEASTRGTSSHVFATLPQLSWGAPVAGGGGGGGEPPPRAPRNPLPPHPASALSVDNILPDGSRDVWGLAARAQSSAITGSHLGRGLSGLREALVLGSPENVSSYARQRAYYGRGARGDTAVGGVWEDVYAQGARGGGSGGGGGGGAPAGGAAAMAPAEPVAAPPSSEPARSPSPLLVVAPTPQLHLHPAPPPPAPLSQPAPAASPGGDRHSQRVLQARIQQLESQLRAATPAVAPSMPSPPKPAWAAPAVFPLHATKSVAFSPSHLASAYSETRASPPGAAPAGAPSLPEVDLDKLFAQAVALEGLLRK